MVSKPEDEKLQKLLDKALYVNGQPSAWIAISSGLENGRDRQLSCWCNGFFAVYEFVGLVNREMKHTCPFGLEGLSRAPVFLGVHLDP